jgi:phosphatidylinositol alpha-1,6-mannosyltransferase
MKMGRVSGLRVIALLTDAYGGIGGIAKFNRDLLSGLNAIPEIEEVVALPRLVTRDPEEIPAKVRFDFAAAGGGLQYIIRTLWTLLTPTRIDLVVCGHLNLLPLAWIVSRFRRSPLVLIVHGIDAWEPHKSWLVRKLIPSVDAIAAVSRYTIERMSVWSAVEKSRFRLLPNCVDLEDFVPAAPDEEMAKRFGLTERRVLMTVGRLAGHERYKGFDEVLDVLPRLADELPDLVYVIVGDGDDRQRLVAKVAALGLQDRVVFTGFVNEREKIALFNLADVYVMPSQGEGFGIVYLEAMACGVPTIGSALDGSRDALMDGQLGQLIDPRDALQLMEAIRSALAKPKGRPAGLGYFSSQSYRERVAVLVRELSGAKS